MGLALGTVGKGVVLVARALAGAKQSDQGLSTVGFSGSPVAENIIDEMKSLEASKTVLLVCISTWTLSIIEREHSSSPSYVSISLSLRPGAWDVPVTDWG